MSEPIKRSALRNLCGDLEDMSVLKDDVSIQAVRVRLEYAVDEIEAALRARDAEIAELRADRDFWRGMVEECSDDNHDGIACDLAYVPIGWWSRIDAALGGPDAS